MKSKIVRIILADESRLFIDSLKSVIESRKLRLNVVETAQNGFDAVKKAEKEQPDVILMDIDLPGADRFKMLKLIRSKASGCKIAILTANTDPRCVEESLRNEVSAYILKDIALSELITLLPLINDKTVVLSRELVSMGVSFKNNFPNEPKKKSNLNSLTPVFSSHEKRILDFICQGFSNREIAEKMYLAEQTVKNYVSNVYAKLGVRTRSQAIEKGKLIL